VLWRGRVNYFVFAPNYFKDNDEEDIVFLFKDALEGRNGFSVVTFTDPTLALKHFIENESDYVLILTDYKMPCMSGLDLIKQVKDRKPSVRTLLMSAFEVDNKLIHEMTSKQILNGYLQKPVRITELRQEINNQLHASEIKKLVESG
jgi:DNA-binding NtrC family response regulator